VIPRGRARIELVAGGLLLLVVVVGGLYFRARPGPTVLDRWAFAAIGPVHHSGLLVALTRVGSPFVVVAAAVAGFLATFRRNQPRAVALLVGPVVAVAGCDWVMKPVVGRTFADVVSFPSGTVTVVAAMAAVALLATPDPWRSVVAAVGGTVTVLECVAVVALRWHYPTDAGAGLALGIGVVLVTDCAARGAASWLARGPVGRDPVPKVAPTRPDAERTTTH
jgi:membrane-associated phospholipid phosphatase